MLVLIRKACYISGGCLCLYGRLGILAEGACTYTDGLVYYWKVLLLIRTAWYISGRCLYLYGRLVILVEGACAYTEGLVY